MNAQRRSVAIMLVSVAVLALLTLGGAGLFTGAQAVVADGLQYNAAAARLLNTGVYSYLTPFTDLGHADQPDAFITPGYILVLAAVYLFLPHTGDANAVIAGAIPWVALLHLICAIGAVLLITETARRTGGARLGWATGILGALYLPFGAEAMSGWSESVGLLLTTAALFFAVRLLQATPSQAPRRALLFGLVGGVAIMMRPMVSLWLLLPLAVWAWQHRRTDRRALARVLVTGCLGILVVMAPWVIRNAITFRWFIPLTTHAGTVWIDGTGGMRMTPAEQAVYDENVNKGRDGFKAVAFDRIRAQLTSDPGGYVAEKLGGAWIMISKPWSSTESPFSPLPAELPQVRGEGYRLLSKDAYRSWTVLIETLHGLVLLLAAVGFVVKRRELMTWMVASVPAYSVAVCVLMSPRPRYFFPTMPAVILLAGIAVVALVGTVQRTRGRSW